MENASKALIIAGAILIAILLISVGIMVMNSMNKPVDQIEKEADSQAIQMFNSQFTQYIGNNKSAREVSSFINILGSVKAENNLVYAFTENIAEPDEGYTLTNFATAGIQERLTNKKTYTIKMGTKDDYAKLKNTETIQIDAVTEAGLNKQKPGYYCWAIINEN